nr:MAG TPA: hypothetical protein [Caudoviricetes sp.]
MTTNVITNTTTVPQYPTSMASSSPTAESCSIVQYLL